MKNFVLGASAAILVTCASAAPVSASTVVAANCISVSDTAGCLFAGNINSQADPAHDIGFKNAEAAYNLFNNSHPSANPDITLNYLGDTDAGFPGTFTGAGGLSGNWTLSAGFLADFVAVKSSQNFILYKLPAPANSASWSTIGLLNKQGRQQELSHLVFFGSSSAVPEPATWLMMVAGFGILGYAMRQKSRTHKLA